jgi:hypothetical protein
LAHPNQIVRIHWKFYFIYNFYLLARRLTMLGQSVGLPSNVHDSKAENGNAPVNPLISPIISPITSPIASPSSSPPKPSAELTDSPSPNRPRKLPPRAEAARSKRFHSRKELQKQASLLTSPSRENQPITTTELTPDSNDNHSNLSKSPGTAALQIPSRRGTTSNVISPSPSPKNSPRERRNTELTPNNNRIPKSGSLSKFYND